MTNPFPLGRHEEAAANHDPRSLNFPVDVAGVTVKNKNWRKYGIILNQGNIGSCTGNACAGCLNHAPLHVVGSKTFYEPMAKKLYSLATHLDPYPGAWNEDGTGEDTGSDGLSVAKAAQQLGFIQAYQHAFGLDHVVSALMVAPLITGTNWHEDMFYPDANGVIHPTGQIAGGHEYVVDGVNVSTKMLRFQNSWGKDWGKRGHFFMSYDDFGSLLNEGGDAVQFVK